MIILTQTVGRTSQEVIMIDATTLAHLIDTRGLTAVEPHVTSVVSIARRRGLVTASVDVLADRSQPEIARLRALARVQRDLAATDPICRSTAA